MQELCKLPRNCANFKISFVLYSRIPPRYLKHALIQISSYLDLFPDLFSVYGLPPYEMYHYPKLRYFELFAISNYFFGS